MMPILRRKSAFGLAYCFILIALTAYLILFNMGFIGEIRSLSLSCNGKSYIYLKTFCSPNPPRDKVNVDVNDTKDVNAYNRNPSSSNIKHVERSPDKNAFLQAYQQNKMAIPKTRRSYELWERIRRHLEVNVEDVNHHIIGNPIQLYSLPDQQTHIRGDLVYWQFPEKSNRLVDCRSLFVERGQNVSSKSTPIDITSEMNYKFQNMLIQAKESCNAFIRRSGYVMSSLTQMEADFPIAFSLLVFKDAGQFEILLRSIYRPQNLYCIHIDNSSSAEFRKSIEVIINCFSNVFITSRSFNVKWGKFSVLEPEIVCLRELWTKKTKWKYFINLTGQELALRTNYELVKILTSFGGANNVGVGRLNKNRLKEAGPLPHELVPVKGGVHVLLSRASVNFILHNDTAIDVLQWAKDVIVPDEIYFSTLSYNKKLALPGSYKGEAKSSLDKNPILIRLKNWEVDEFVCNGKAVRGICIFVTKDLPLLGTSHYLFANKAHFEYHPEVTLCMQELLYNRTADEYNGYLNVNVSYYESLDFVRNKF